MSININNEHDVSRVSDLILGGFDENENCNKYYSGLCVPQDRLEDIEFFPNFNDDLISLSGLLDWDTSKHETISNGEFPTGKDFPGFQESDAKEKLNSCNSLQTKEQKRKRVPLEEILTTEINKKHKLGNTNRIYGDEDFTKKSFLTRNEVENYIKRRCSHCQTEKTPQWRMGPKGPTTLCNACGVRYRLGMLVPEYRPAASPTFDHLKHSNSHKKILQLQRTHYLKDFL
ncbi:GATA transcription factor 4-like [Abeliophyllum distichum]|uniref:GATA transcription factor 4-like n=1 Tax=Abeliophyllum distichum TaxID=126358 RepID=A0ABD1SW86_9LAMI